MRVLAAVVLATLASAAGAQAAMFPTPIPVRGLPHAKVEIKLERTKPHASPISCTAHARAKIGKTQRRLVPVACEQPPRSNVLDSAAGILLAP